MFLYLIRHGIAEPRETPGLHDDGARELTPAGVKKMRRNGEALANLGVMVTEVWTSPLVRARQTADLLVAELGLAGEIKVVQALEPGGDFGALTAELARCANRRGIALIGHEPDMGELATYLLTGLKTSAVQFKKGGVACIEVDDFEKPIRGQLHWLLTPKQMAGIAKA